MSLASPQSTLEVITSYLERTGRPPSRDSVLDALVELVNGVANDYDAEVSPKVRNRREATVSPPDTGTVPTDGPGDTSVGRLDGGETPPET